ncbi:hypothetical protein K0M31_013403, partial [Melipona bicolor]
TDFLFLGEKKDTKEEGHETRVRGSKYTGIVSQKGAQEERGNMKSIDSFAIPSCARLKRILQYLRRNSSKLSTTDPSLRIRISKFVSKPGKYLENCRDRRDGSIKGERNFGMH